MIDPRVEELKRRIDDMSHEEMARTWRFAPAGEPMFTHHEVFAYFQARFEQFGGMTPEISKKIRWGPYDV